MENSMDDSSFLRFMVSCEIMTTQHTCHTLRLRWKSGTHSTLNIKESARTTGYEVIDEESGQQVGSIDNARASGLPAGWQISRVKDGASTGKPTGDYATAEDALAAFQREFDTTARIA
jgi:hypothetical protein